MTDLPHGAWSTLLVGHQWPGRVALAALSASAEQRHATATAHTGYADLLRSIRTDLLGSQEGIAAEATHRAFHAGESTAQDIASRNEAKRDAYRTARQQVAELRSALSEIAEAGNAEIARIQQSKLPLPEKIGAIVDAVVTGQEQANAKAAACGAILFDAIQTVLTAADSRVSAREFTGSRGVEWHSAFRSPHPDQVRHHVERALDPSAPAVPGGPAHPAPPERPVTGPPPPAVPAALVPGPAETATAQTTGPAGPASPSADARVFAAGVLGAPPPRDTALPAPATPAIPAAPATAAIPAAIAAAVGPPAAARAASPPASVGVATAPHHSGTLLSYGADLRAPTATAPLTASRMAPAAVPTSAPINPANPAGPVIAPPVMNRQQGPSVKTGSVAGVAEKTTGTAGHRLRRLLDAVARQQPRLGWTIGDHPDGRILLVAGLAGGWVPPGIAIPDRVSLPDPAAARSESAGLTGVLTHAPGQPVSPHGEADALPTSVQPRAVTPVADLGWELSRTTRWRDGLPRLAHTIARAAIVGTGLLDSEMVLLDEELRAAEARVLTGYPDVVDPAALGNWQLLAAIDALASGETVSAHYHFAWFRAAS